MTDHHERKQHESKMHGQNEPAPRVGLHRKPWVWVVGILLMLGAILAYVLSMDGSVVPGEKIQPRMPAAP
ncbi:MAG: hypothetical protein U0575_16140 [Phycisphaerales bacterium]|jgi:hypothetical protein